VIEQKFSGFLDLHDSWRTWTWRGFLRQIGPVEVCQKPRLREFAILVLRLGHWFGFARGGRAKLFQSAAIRLAKRVGEANQKDFSNIGLTELVCAKSEMEQYAGLVGADNYIVLVPGSAWRGKCWPEKRYIELAKLFSLNQTVIVLGGANDSSALAIAEAAAPLSPKSTALLNLPLRQVMVVLKGASLVIGNDTGLLHMADALAIKNIVIEGPTHEYLGFSTYRETSQIVGAPLWCRPCSKTGNICWRWNSRACLTEITAAKIGALAQTQLPRARQ